jgi:hypothetical protein
MSDTTVRDSQWPSGQQRAEDREWFGIVKQYDGVILVIIAVVIIIGGVITWMDRRDSTEMFRRMGDQIAQLTAEARGVQAVLSRVEGTVGTLSRQNERWISVEREVTQLREISIAAQSKLRDVEARVQRIEDQRASEKELRK